MIHDEINKKDYVVPHIEVTWMGGDKQLMDEPMITGSVPDQPWSAKSSVVTHFDSDFDLDDEFDDGSTEGYESYKIEW